MDPSPADSLQEFLDRHERLCVLTGAGCSAASGIPEYRDDDGAWKHAQPVQYADFVASPGVRRRYWARSYHGWRRISAAQPNAAHTALAELDRDGRLAGLITQNVDDLHRRAGSRNVIDLHGVLARTRCLDCGRAGERRDWQARLAEANPDWTATAAGVLPDGDSELDDAAYTDFLVPGCPACSGVIKPDVVFFGETVPAGRVARARALVAAADAMLVVGSSLMVFSGYRFVRQAHAAGIPVAILNRGRTRADDLASLRLRVDCGAALTAVAAGNREPRPC